MRRLREKEARRAVVAKRGEIVRMDDEQRRIHADIEAALLRLRELAHTDLFDPSAVSRCRAWVAQRRAASAELDGRRAARMQELERLQAAWRDARSAHRVIEKLREKRWQEYIRARAGQEQREADELAQQLQFHGRMELESGVSAENDDRAQT